MRHSKSLTIWMVSRVYNYNSDAVFNKRHARKIVIQRHVIDHDAKLLGNSFNRNRNSIYARLIQN